MDATVLRSRCECQASLVAEVTSSGQVLSGRASHRGRDEVAPATRTRSAGSRLDIGWQCPFCGRNTLRSFDLQGENLRGIGLSRATALRCSPPRLSVRATAARLPLMSPALVQRQTAAPSSADDLPLRSLTPIWVGLGLLGFTLGVLAVRGLGPPRRAAAAARAAASAPKGPSKEEVRQRQEHIALTQRALGHRS